MPLFAAAGPLRVATLNVVKSAVLISCGRMLKRS